MPASPHRRHHRHHDHPLYCLRCCRCRQPHPHPHGPQRPRSKGAAQTLRAAGARPGLPGSPRLNPTPLAFATGRHRCHRRPKGESGSGSGAAPTVIPQLLVPSAVAPLAVGQRTRRGRVGCPRTAHAASPHPASVQRAPLATGAGVPLLERLPGSPEPVPFLPLSSPPLPSPLPPPIPAATPMRQPTWQSRWPLGTRAAARPFLSETAGVPRR